MRLRHFEALKPRCPVCMRDRGGSEPLALASIAVADGDVVVEGVLLCPERACQREYPIIDGIPILLAGLRAFLAENLFALMMRDDFSETIDGLLGDCSGPGSLLDVTRHQLGSYARDHYGLEDPAEDPAQAPAPGAAARVLDRGLALAAAWPTDRPVIDVGCSVGGTTFALAERTGQLVLGVDLNLSMLRLASSALLRGIVQYPRKRTGVVYDRRRFPVRPQRPENVDFWACDAAALPFPEGTFALGSLLNVIDCVRAPRDVIAECARVLVRGGKAIVTSPYDWSPMATPMEAWLGGHSQRGADHGASAPVLRALLTPGGHPAAIEGLALEAEEDDVPWHVRLHDRSTVAYGVHLAVARKA